MQLTERDLLNAPSAREWLSIFGQEDFGVLWTEIATICNNEHGWPVGIKHVRFFNNLAGGLIPDDVEAWLTVTYTYIAASFFCLDHLADGESRNQMEPMAVPLLLNAATRHILDVCQSLGLDARAEARELGTLYARFAEAMAKEKLAKSQPLSGWNAGDTDHMVGRSEIVYYMYAFTCRAARVDRSEVVVSILQRLVLFMQRGDDWGDWRTDYQNSNWTPFLRKCVVDLGRIPADEAELERHIYLSGAYEEEGDVVAEGLDAVARDLQIAFGSRAAAFSTVISRCATRARGVVENFNRIKRGQTPLPLPEPVH